MYIITLFSRNRWLYLHTAHGANLIHSGQREHEDAEQEVRHGQADDDGVGRPGELGRDLDSGDDQDVAECDDEADQAQGHQGANNLQVVIFRKLQQKGGP